MTPDTKVADGIAELHEQAEPGQVWPAQDGKPLAPADHVLNAEQRRQILDSPHCDMTGAISSQEALAIAEGGPITDKLDARGVGITIHNCGACDGKHEDVKVMEFTRPAGPFTHWFTCPTLHDPVNVTLGLLSNGQGLQLDGPILQSLAQAQLAGMFMVVVAYIDPTKNHAMTLTRHTHKFPSADVYESKGNLGFMGLLRENLEKEFGLPQPMVMKEVKPNPLRSLMGDILDRAKEAQETPTANLGDRVSEAMQTLPPD